MFHKNMKNFIKLNKITKDYILLIGGEEEYNLIDNGRHVCKFHPNQIIGIIRK